MEILVINGSPKGKNSVTLQTIHYLQLLHPEHHFDILHAGQSIKALERDFSPAVAAVEKADVLLFCYPVYTFIAPCQLHRFIELLKEAKLDLSGKYASQISTSKHFYDVTAHRYIEDNCGDLGLRYVQGLSADMDDLTAEKGQEQADAFLQFLCWSVENGIYEPAAQPLSPPAHMPVSVPESSGEKSGDVVIVADLCEEDTQLRDMIARFRAVLPRKTRVVNIREYPFRGGCLGCFNCAVSGKCVYTDGFDDYLRNEIQTADAIVYAFTIRDHSMGSNYLTGTATDEQDTDAAIDRLCAKLTYALDNRYLPPQNFYGIGGMKIFRDLIWLMQGMMKADHKFYKAHGQYDFPQKQWPKMLAMYGVGALLSSKKLKAKMGSAMTDGMLMPYKKVLEKVKKTR